MLIYEENGIKQSFKIILSSNGIIIKTHGAFSSSYNEVYSRQYAKIGYVETRRKFLITEFVIGSILLKFDNENAAKIIKILIGLGKTNPSALLPYVGEDDKVNHINNIRVSDLEKYADKNRFAKKTDSPKEVISSTTASSKLSVMSPPPPPPEFRIFAMIDGKQEGPYDEPQFERLVQYGVVNKDTYIWHEGLSEWKHAFMVEILSKFFKDNKNGSMPPPPPTIG